MRGARRPVVIAMATLIASTSVAIAIAPTAYAAPNCAAFDDAVQYRVNPTSATGLLTSSQTAADTAAGIGYTENRGVLFKAAIQSDSTLSVVHRLYKSSTKDYIFVTGATEITKAKASGYVDYGSSFSASKTAAACLAPVYRYVRKSSHQYAATTTARSALVTAGWKLEGVSFYAAPAGTQPPPATGDAKFSFAVMPDTQQEVLNAKDPRFINRSKWLVANKAADVRWVASGGDVVNWDTPDHDQYKVVDKAMVPLEQAKIPYTLTIGNHDTQATKSPGGARDAKRTRILQKDTTTFNAYFNAKRYTQVAGAYEKGKIDNIYTSYTAGDRKWMMLVLELWPRKAVVDWAKQVVAANPDHNVVIATHNYIDGAGKLGTSAQYGDTSPQYLYDNLVKQYTNIKFMLCGHTGRAGSRVDTGVKGNKIVTFNTTMHSNTTNPVRLVEVDTSKGTVTSKVHGPATGETFTAYTTSHTGMTYVK